MNSRIFAIAAVASFALACGETQAPNPPPGGGPTTDVASVTILPAGRPILAGSRLALGTRVLDTLGHELLDENVTWSVSSTTIGSITADGVATFDRPGAITISATVDGVAGQVTMDVIEVEWSMLDAGRGHTCGLTTAGVAWCWGYAGRGAVGYGGSENQLVPIPVATALRFTTIRSGGWTTCGLTAQGAAHCWGAEGGAGHVDGMTADALVPSAISGGHAFTDITVGGLHACGLTADGAAWCWGYGLDGQLGYGSAVSSRAPQLVSGGVQFTQLSAGWNHTCGIATDGAAWCWGGNIQGQVGTLADDEVCDPNTFPAPFCHTAPVPVESAETFSTISAGLGHTCAISTTGAAWCWGANARGQLGNFDFGDPERTPVAVAGGGTFSSISAGYWASGGEAGFTCALSNGPADNGGAYCWGENSDGRLGTGVTEDRAAPHGVATSLTFSSISAGQDQTCATRADGTAYCWGGNRMGELGTGSGVEQSLVPVRVPGQAD